MISRQQPEGTPHSPAPAAARPAPAPTDWHRLDAATALQRLETDAASGLSAEEAARRLEARGPNELTGSDMRSPWRILWEQLTATMVVVLILSAIASALLGDLTDSLAILVIVALNAALGFTQERRAENAMAALQKLAVPTVRARRGGQAHPVSARDLVPGDIALLEAGNLVPADCRLLEGANLRAQEAILTGESEPVEKRPDPQPEQNPPLGDRWNRLYMGTVLTYGHGVALVTETGMATELGRIAAMMQNTQREQTPLQKRLDRLGKALAGVALLLIAIIVGMGLLRGEPLRALFLTGVSMAVAAIPEGLPAVVTISLALGAQRMLRRGALIRRLPAVETLGSVTVICSDKTGTLTENRMTVTTLDVVGHRLDLRTALSGTLPGGSREGSGEVTEEAVRDVAAQRAPALALLLVGGALCNDAILPTEEEPAALGDPTEIALLTVAQRLGLDRDALERAFPRIGEVPFDSERKRMTTIHARAGIADTPAWPLASLEPLDPESEGVIAFVKGAADGLLDLSASVWNGDHAEPLDAAWKERLQEEAALLAQNGMRVLGAAFRSLPDLPPSPGIETERELTFIGLTGMIDPVRPEAREAVQTCLRAGIRPILITGDHPLTARFVAEDLGLSAEDGILTGQELEALPPGSLEATVEKISLYARVSPEHKLRIVEALQERGHIVAMTGDGVNDAPALKKADIGVAMGIQGTDVAKEAAHMVLLDDNFATIVAAVEEGRIIYDNTRKFIRYLLSANTGELCVMLLGPLLGMPLPLLPLQILWMNLVTDGLPALALSLEPAERNIMRRAPYPPNESVFARGMGMQILLYGLFMGLPPLALGWTLWRSGHPAWQTAVFTTLTLAQMTSVLAVRSERDSLLRVGLLSNKPMLGAILLTFLLQIALIYTPFLQRFFATQPLTLPDFALCLGVSALVCAAIELEKWARRLRARHAAPGG